jgi:hypothetical protein
VPFSGFDDFDDCLRTMTEEEGHDQNSAENICGALQAEEKSDHGDVDALRQALERGAGLIADVGVDLVSGVDVPAVDSKWVMTKDADGHDWRANSPILLSKQDGEDDEDDEDAQRIAYAAAMIPREPDKEGDVVATPTVEKAAHGFLKQGGGVDTDHSLIDGEGEVVESWVLKQDRGFDLPGGATEQYDAGTWMVGIEWGKDAWERIQAGDLTGLSIYGMAEHVPLGKAATTARKDFVVPFADESVVNVLYASRSVAAKAARRLGFEGTDEEVTHPHSFGDVEQYMPAPSHSDYVDAYNDFAEADGFGPTADGETVRATAKDEEDPCWEGYTMVGTQANGDPRCVPDDDVPDVDFDKAIPLSEGPPPEIGDTHKSDDKEPDSMAHSDGDGDGDGPGPTVADIAASVADLSDTVAELKDAVGTDAAGADTADETDKADMSDAAAELADEHGMRPGDVMDVLEVAEGNDPADVLEAIESMEASAEEVANAEHGDDKDEDEDDEMEMGTDAEKRAETANLAKGTDGTETAQPDADADPGHDAGGLSYRAVAESEGDI